MHTGGIAVPKNAAEESRVFSYTYDKYELSLLTEDIVRCLSVGRMHFIPQQFMNAVNS